MTTASEPLVFNPLDPNFRIDPYPVYKRLREEDPLHRGLFESWVFSRYAECLAVLRDPRSSSDGRNSEAFQQFVREQGYDPTEELLGGTRPFLFLDPPDHTRLRGLVSSAFTPKRVEELRPRVQEIVDELLNAVAKQGALEVVEDLAYPLPVIVICELMGVPTEDQRLFKEWSRELARSLDPEELVPQEVVERRRRAIDSFVDYFRALIERRRQDLREDLLSALIVAEEQGDKLTEAELLSTCILLLVAGHETTVNLIGNGVLALLRHPDQLDLLRRAPSLAARAVEEVLRYDPPVQMTARTALEDMEVSGVTVRKGQQAILLLASANRDPEQFPDPDRFDIARAGNHHLAFGHGAHFCLGAPLARLEGEVALRAFAQRLRVPRLLAETPEYKENIIIRGLASLSVGFSEVERATN